MSLQEAYQAWVATFPGRDKDCCHHLHHTIREEVATTPSGLRLRQQIRVPKPDSQVCARERAWRNYISIRDRKDYRVAG